MAFRFTEGDFRGYVKTEEHGGRHIWHDLQERLGELFGVPFSSVPYIARGDRLQKIWFAPKGGPRSTWSNQAQFFLSRSVTEKRLTFGLQVERPTQADITAMQLAPDLDALRLIAQLRNNRSFAGRINEFARKPNWVVGVEQWGKRENRWLACTSSSEILSRVESFPPEQGWSVNIQRSLSAEEAIAAGEGIVDQIVDAYKALRSLWEEVIPEADREFLRTGIGPKLPEPTPLPSPPTQATSADPLAKLAHPLSAQGLHFTDWQLATFYTALQTKGFVILSGISGTGKTKLAQAFARLLPQPQESDNWLFTSVRPDWRDSKSLLGYYNPLAGSYEWTDFLRFLQNAERNYRSENPLAWFVILDEMNLAHVEYYFADLLSVLESGRDEEGWTREPLRLSYPAEAQGDLPPHELRLPPNLYIVGTVNVDETTQAFSPKVLDRAFTLELTEADFSTYPPSASEGQDELSDAERQAILADFSNGGAFAQIDKGIVRKYVQEHPEVRERLQKLNGLLRPHDLHFGYRVFDEIVSFLAAAERNGLYKDLGGAEAAFDAAVLMKVLPKFHGSRGKLEVALKKVLAWCLDPDQPAIESVEQTIQDGERAGNDAMAEKLLALNYTYPRAASRVVRMLRALYETGFAAFA